MADDGSNGANVEESCCSRSMYCYSVSSENEQHHDFLNNIANDPPEIRALIFLNRNPKLYRCTESFRVLMLKKMVYMVIHNHYAV